jgi:hypothetical protein
MILADEVGHVAYVRSTLGPAQLGLARAMLPAVVHALTRDVPELFQLFSYERVMAETRKADLSVNRQAVVAVA